MPSYLHLRYGGKIKQFIWPMEPSTALQAIGHAFSINPDTIVGFKDKKGSIHEVEDLLRDPEEAQKQSYMVVVETEDKRGQVSARSQTAKNAQNQPQNTTQNLGLMLISNYLEFERIFLKGSPNSWFIIFVLNQRQQLDDIGSKAAGLISQFSDKVDFFTYFYSESSEDLSVMSRNFPLILVYHGEKRLVEVPLGSNQKNLTNLLERVQNGPSQDRTNQASQGNQISLAENSSTKLALNQLDALFKQNEVTGVEYYYTKTSLLERQGDTMAIFSRYAKTGDSDQLKSDIKDLTAREPRLASQAVPSRPQPQVQPQVMKQNFVRPTTSEGRPKSQKPQSKSKLSLAQEKSLETTEELESKRLISVQDANIIKEMIMEENASVLELIDSYDADVDDERELCQKLTRFTSKLGKNQENYVQRRFEADERPQTQGGASYFLESKSKKGQREHLYEKDAAPKSEDFPPVRRQEQVGDLVGALKSSNNVRNLPVEQYGMVIWMASNKANIVRDIINDCGGIDEIDRAVSSIVLLADKELNSKLRENFNERQRAYINDNKSNWNSSTHAAFKCFKYDQDLPGLLRSLEDAVNDATPAESKATPSQIQSASQADKLIKSGGDSGNKRQKEYMFPQNFSDLAVIREEDKVPSTKHATYNEGINTGFESAISSQGEIGQSSKPSPPAASSTQEQGRLSAGGSKYSALLSRDQRADSFKGMFQLKLISSDNPAASRDQTTRGEVVQSKPEADEGTKNSLDAHVNVIIPAKTDVNPFIQTIIDKFYESQNDYLEGLENFKDVLLNFTWITGDDVAKIEYLYENFYYELFEVIYNYEMNKDLKELERRLKEDILPVDLDNISTASTSPRERKRMTTYHSFKALLQNLKNDNLISDKQYKTYLYLYTEEDVTVLASYEVYQYTRDISDFIDTLLSIEKVQFFKMESKYFEDISNFSDKVEYQLKIIFSLKRYLTSETRATLEKIIRSGDTTIMQIYREYKKNRDNKNKNNLIHKLVNFAEENTEVVKNYEKTIVQNKLIGEHKNVKRRETIENFEAGRLLPEVKHYQLLYDSIDRDEELIHSIFEIFDYTKDKIDFIENITLVYKFLYRMFALEILDKHKEKYGLTLSDLELVDSMFKKKENSILGPTELLYATKDELEFVETVSLLIQAKRKIRPL